MEIDKEKVVSAEKRLLGNSGGIEQFAVKTVIVLVIILVLANFLLPDFSQLKHLETPKAKLVLLSFIQNPQALLKISEIEEAEGKIDNSIREIELAIGLLEMHGADKQAIQKYSDRVNELKAKKNSMASPAPADNR